MPTEIVAAPISTLAVPQGMAVNPVFDWSPLPAAFGWPLWLYITAFGIFVWIAINVYWWARIRKLNAVRGWEESKKKMDPNDVQVWLITRTLSLFILCLKIEDNILSYHDKTKIGMWHHQSKQAVINIGGQPAVVLSDDWDHTRDLVSEIALTDNCDMFNEDQAKLQSEYDEENKRMEEKARREGRQPEPHEYKMARVIKGYDDYADFGRDFLEHIHPNGLEISSYSRLDNLRYLKYYPEGCGAMFFGGELTLDARNLNVHKKEKGFLEKYGLFIGALIFVIIMIGAAGFVPLK